MLNRTIVLRGYSFRSLSNFIIACFSSAVVSKDDLCDIFSLMPRKFFNPSYYLIFRSSVPLRRWIVGLWSQPKEPFLSLFLCFVSLFRRPFLVPIPFSFVCRDASNACQACCDRGWNLHRIAGVERLNIIELKIESADTYRFIPLIYVSLLCAILHLCFLYRLPSICSFGSLSLSRLAISLSQLRQLCFSFYRTQDPFWWRGYTSYVYYGVLQNAVICLLMPIFQWYEVGCRLLNAVYFATFRSYT